MNTSVADIGTLLRSYFDRILVLTVPRFQERQDKVRRSLDGVPFEFFNGFDKEELTKDFLREHYHHDKRNTVTVSLYAKPLNPGEIACALSHREIYRRMISEGWQRVLIFEDDVVPDTKNLPLLPEMLAELPPDWELFYLGYLKNADPDYRAQVKNFWYRIQSSLGWSKLPPRMVRNLLPKPFSSRLMRAGYHDCTHAYALTIDAARKLLELQTPVRYRADNGISYLVLQQAIHAFASKPPVFHQEVFLDKSSKSYIR
ncbi:MAG TPA: glycosyltransferase family 25 protein [Chitinophagaceae bacterium]|nr:glycosyltransferase family 25 protein [Chitinophagaceae bacterium]